MADFDKSFRRIIYLEFKDANDALHKNDGENGLTYMGVYQSAHPNWIGWKTIIEILEKHKGDLKKASQECYQSTILYSAVGLFYDKEFFTKMKLDKIKSQQIADEMFCGGINYNTKVAVKLAQRVVGVLDDGIIGNKTLEALNKFDDKVFDKEFDKLELDYYEKLVIKRPEFKRNIKGWRNRAVAI